MKENTGNPDNKVADFKQERLFRQVQASQSFGSLADYLREHKGDIVDYKPPCTNARPNVLNSLPFLIDSDLS